MQAPTQEMFCGTFCAKYTSRYTNLNVHLHPRRASTAKPHPSGQLGQAWTCSCSVPGKQVPGAGVPGSSQKAYQHPCSALLSPATSAAAGGVGRELQQHPPHPSQTHLPPHPSKRPQSHQPTSPGLPPRAVMMQQPCYHCSSATLLRSPWQGIKALPPGRWLWRERKCQGEHREGLQGSTLHLCAAVAAAKHYLGVSVHTEFSYYGSLTQSRLFLEAHPQGLRAVHGI